MSATPLSSNSSGTSSGLSGKSSLEPQGTSHYVEPMASVITENGHSDHVRYSHTLAKRPICTSASIWIEARPHYAHVLRNWIEVDQPYPRT